MHAVSFSGHRLDPDNRQPCRFLLKRAAERLQAEANSNWKPSSDSGAVHLLPKATTLQPPRFLRGKKNQNLCSALDHMRRAHVQQCPKLGMKPPGGAQGRLGQWVAPAHLQGCCQQVIEALEVAADAMQGLRKATALNVVPAHGHACSVPGLNPAALILQRLSDALRTSPTCTSLRMGAHAWSRDAAAGVNAQVHHGRLTWSDLTTERR